MQTLKYSLFRDIVIRLDIFLNTTLDEFFKKCTKMVLIIYGYGLHGVKNLESVRRKPTQHI